MDPSAQGTWTTCCQQELTSGDMLKGTRPTLIIAEALVGPKMFHHNAHPLPGDGMNWGFADSPPPDLGQE